MRKKEKLKRKEKKKEKLKKKEGEKPEKYDHKSEPGERVSR